MFNTTCARSPFSTFPSPWYQASHSWRASLGHPHSVLGPLSAVQYCTPSQSGWQICSAGCPDPALPSPVAGNARANSRVPCLHTCKLHVLHSIHLASGPHASRSTLKLRPVYLHSMWCPSTSVQHCAPYTPGGRLQCSISRPRLLSSDTGRRCTTLRALLPLQCCAFTWQ